MFRTLQHVPVKLKVFKGYHDGLAITYDEVIDLIVNLYDDVSETVSINLNDKKATCKTGYYYLHIISFVTIQFFFISNSMFLVRPLVV